MEVRGCRGSQTQAQRLMLALEALSEPAVRRVSRECACASVKAFGRRGSEGKLWPARTCVRSCDLGGGQAQAASKTSCFNNHSLHTARLKSRSIV